MRGWACSVGRTASSLLQHTTVEREHVNRRLAIVNYLTNFNFIKRNVAAEHTVMCFPILKFECALCAFSLFGVSDIQTLFQLFSIVCKLPAIFMRTFYILGITFMPPIQFGNIIKVALL